MPPKKRCRVDLEAIKEVIRESDNASPIPSSTAAKPSTPTFQDLYGDDEDAKSSPLKNSPIMPQIPSLCQLQFQSRRPRNSIYQRRNSVTKFSLQANTAQRMSVLEAARMTLQKLRQEKWVNEDEDEEDRANSHHRFVRAAFRP